MFKTVENETISSSPDFRSPTQNIVLMHLLHQSKCCSFSMFFFRIKSKTQEKEEEKENTASCKNESSNLLILLTNSLMINFNNKCVLIFYNNTRETKCLFQTHTFRQIFYKCSKHLAIAFQTS